MIARAVAASNPILNFSMAAGKGAFTVPDDLGQNSAPTANAQVFSVLNDDDDAVTFEMHITMNGVVASGFYEDSRGNTGTVTGNYLTPRLTAYASSTQGQLEFVGNVTEQVMSDELLWRGYRRWSVWRCYSRLSIGILGD